MVTKSISKPVEDSASKVKDQVAVGDDLDFESSGALKMQPGYSDHTGCGKLIALYQGPTLVGPHIR